MNSTNTHDASRPVAVFDSGLGGLTVVRQIQSLLPGEDVVYLGDTARVPYGIRDPDTVRQFALEDAQFLLRFGPKLIVVGCNTASAVAMPTLKAALPVEVIGVVAPAAAEAVRMAFGRSIGVIGTECTISSGAYQRAIHDIDPNVAVTAAPAPLLVPIVEEGRPQDDPIVMHVLGDYLRQLQRVRPAVLIMGCTHYPLLQESIHRMIGPNTRLVDPGVAVAAEVRKYLDSHNLRNPQPAGKLKCFSTGSAERFAQLAGRFLGREVEDVSRVGTDELGNEATGNRQ
jgi:glutamate racemase